MKFSEVIGQDALKKMLARAADEGRVSHAQLFVGATGSGSLALALAYAQYLNCNNRADGDSCGVCASCVKMSALAHPDLHFVYPVNSASKSGSQKPLSDAFLPQWRDIYGKSGGYFGEQEWYRTIGIDNQQGIVSRNEADEIIRKLSFKPFETGYKIMVVWLPERMRTEAANTILKILEEPWERTIFLMVSEAPEKLLPTIISRTQEMAVPAIETADMEAWLAREYNLEGGQLTRIARLSGGNVLEARRLVAGGDEDALREYFDHFASLMRLSYNDRHMELLEWADGVASMGREEQKRFLQYCVRLLRENYMLNAGMESVTYLWGDELDFSKKFSPFIGNHNIEKLVSEIELAARQIAQNGNARIIFPHFALTVSKLIVRR